MTILEEAEAMAVRLEELRGYFNASEPTGQALHELTALLRRMIEQMRGEGV